MNLSFLLFTFAILAPPNIGVNALDDRQCGSISDRQRDYRGDTAITASGRTCQYWSSQSPNAHGNTPESKPGTGVGDHNYCRNPDGEPKAWCYTMDPAKRWELCNVPDCDDATFTYPTLAPAPAATEPVTPEMIAEAYAAPTDGWCINAANGARPDMVFQDGLYASDAEAAGVCYNFCESFTSAPGFVGMQWRTMSKGARCVCYFDDGTVPDVLPGGVSTKTGNEDSVGPVIGTGDVGHSCYRFKGYMDATRLAIYGTGEALTDFINFDIYGTQVQVANAEVEYDQNQNPIYAGMVPPTFSDDHTSLTASGNRWSAYLLPDEIEVHKDTKLEFSFTLNEETVDGFQAICLDQDTEETGSNGRCFVLRSSQGWIPYFVNVPTQTGINETSFHSIPIGQFFTGPVNYVAYLQDSDGERSKGKSTISDLKLISASDDRLEIEIDGQMEFIENDQISFTSNNGVVEDTDDYWLHLSEDHKAVQINGNQWKALPLPHTYDVTVNTMLEFDVVIDQSVDWTGICLDLNSDAGQGNDCVILQNPKDAQTNYHHLTTKLTTGTSKRVVIPFGSYRNLKEGEVEQVNYIAFIQDNDQGLIHEGRSTFSHFRLYQDVRFPIELSILGEDTTVANIQEPLQNDAGDMQDSRDHIMSVSADGKTITATSNSWKFLKLPTTFEVTPATMLKFDFALQQQSELHTICLLDEIRMKDGRNDCFFTAGLQDQSNSQGTSIYPYTVEGETRSYDIPVGSYFTGEVKYLGIVVDNDLGFTAGDVERTLGQSSWSNLEVYNLPSLEIGLDEAVISVENHQVSYDQNQDTTPVRNYMATVSDDGSSIMFGGDVWRALELPTPLSPAELGDFVVSFDFNITEAAEIHAICFEENLEYGQQNQPSNTHPRRCVATAYFQDRPETPNVMFADYQATVGESHRYILNLSKMFDRRYNPIKYIAFVHDNDLGDGSAGSSTYSNIAITTSLSSCLDSADFSFDLDDCTAENFLQGVEEAMVAKSETCGSNPDPLMELMALFGATQEMDVYMQIEKICTASYKSHQYDFSDNILATDEALERQLIREYLDGGTILNYEVESDSAVNVGYVNEAYAASKLLSMPKHHALDNCKVNAAMCCFVSSKANPAQPTEDNSDVCYVDMKASRRTAHVADGWSMYPDDEPVYCEGFAWGNDGGSMSSATKGNALFHVSLMDNLFTNGNVEQIPGAPLCGCMDRMPVVTNAACTNVSNAGSSVNVTFSSAAGMFRSTFTPGTIEYSNCNGGSLVEHYASLVDGGKATSADLAYMQERVVGDGGCTDAITGFLAKKGLAKA